MPNEFVMITENLSLDFLNTKIVRHGKTNELLNTSKDLYDWVAAESLEEKYKFQLEYLSPYFKSVTDISEVISFREYIFTKICNTLSGKNSFSHLQQWIEKELQALPFFVEFYGNKRVLVPTEKNFKGFKSLIFIHLSSLTQHKELDKLSRCENPECVLLFVNKTGRRKWCSMKICGNRSKVERYEQKHK